MKDRKNTTRILAVGALGMAVLPQLLGGFSAVSNEGRLQHYELGSSSAPVPLISRGNSNSTRSAGATVEATHSSSRHNHHHHHHTVTKSTHRHRLLQLHKLAMEILQVDSFTSTKAVKGNVDRDDFWNATTIVTNASDDEENDTIQQLLEQRLGQALHHAGLQFLIPSATDPNDTTTPTMSDWPRPVVLENLLAVRRYRVSRQKTFLHFLVHIPKSGTSYAFSALRNLLWSHPHHAQLVAAGRHEEYRPCNVAVLGTATFHKWKGDYKGHVCNMWMSETRWTNRAQHAYVVLRKPRDHVLSQYFHCLEAEEHRRKEKMPTNLTVWLQAWNDVILNNNATSLERRKENSKFFCYTPVNLQSTYVWPTLRSNFLLNLTAAAGSENVADMLVNTVLGDRSPTNHESSSLNVAGEQDSDPLTLLAQDLLDRFEVVGDTSRMVLSVCLMFVKYTGFLAPQCDCTPPTDHSHDNNDKTRIPSNSRRRLNENKIGYQPDRHAHGVKHHGATYQTTPYQDYLIDRLTQFDQLLYDIGRRVLDIQVDQVEKEYQVQLCTTKFRTQDSEQERGKP